MLRTRYIALFALLTLTGCPTTNSDPPPSGDAGAGGGNTPIGAAGSSGGAAGQATLAPTDAGGAGAGESVKLPPPDAGGGNPGGKPIGVGCATNAECATGFCVDSMCCNTACDGQCETCNVSGNEGYCTPQITGDDTTSAETCTGAYTCALSIPGVPGLDVPVCRLKTLQACKSNSDCASLLCQTFYVDHDGDGYGETTKTISFCEVDGATPPAGYSAVGGDCCDSDNNTFPGQTKYFTVANICGGWDYNCDGVIEANTGLYKETLTNSSTCGVIPPKSTAPLACQ
jgi:hypothetical protein